VLQAPNRGRDILPFLRTARPLTAKGYEYFLKMHSKKSTHRSDGSDWFKEMTSDLVPASGLDELKKTITKKNSAIVGPAGQYTSLNVNFEANGWHMTHILNRL